MRVIGSLDELPSGLANPILTIGSYDGVHRGHQEILRRLVARARQTGGHSIVLTFVPHPQKVVSPQDAPPLLQTPEQNEDTLAQFGVDFLVLLPFSQEFSQYSPRRFVECIIEGSGIREIFVGSNFRFGHARQGDVEALKSLGREFGFEVNPVSFVSWRGKRISSSKIRRLLLAGNAGLAGRYLGRPFQLRGVVVSGDGRGRRIGFPTANLDCANELVPANGVYVGNMELDGDFLPSVMNIGYRPTVRPDYQGRPVVECHVLDFDHNLYGREVSLNLCLRLRSEKKFAGVEELVGQVGRDIERARRYLAWVGRVRLRGTQGATASPAPSGKFRL